MHWLLQENLFKESEWEKLVSTLERFNIPYSVHKVIPFIGELIPPAEPKHSKVICFGSYSMRHAAKREGWTPGVYDLFDVNFKVQLEHWGDEMLNADSKICRFEEATITELTFIRPYDDSKYFAGQVFDPEKLNKKGEPEYERWRYGVCVMEEDYGDSLTKDTLVQMCKPKVIYAEYRYWIVDGKIVTRSLYKRGHRVIYSPDVDKRFDYYVGKIIQDGNVTLSCGNRPKWLPRAFVIDVADTPDGIKIVEINTINSAGFYAGDVQALVLALENAEN